ncbi:MAG: PepSY-like domain-containing protein [Sphingobacteriales bacterium]|nr:PepSY-like domain-containing protein [Sphingobacteriales bacterium]
MKKTLVLFMAIVAISLSLQAQKINDAKVPAVIKLSFAKQYPGSTAKWEKEDGRYEANFKSNGNNMSALFDVNGMLLESEIDIKKSDLPTVIISYIKEHYKGSVIKEAAKITKADGTVNYEAEVNHKDLIFDVNGKFIKEHKD